MGHGRGATGAHGAQPESNQPRICADFFMCASLATAFISQVNAKGRRELGAYSRGEPHRLRYSPYRPDGKMASMGASKLVFVSYTSVDRELVRPLVRHLDRKLREIDGAIFWDQDLRVGAPINDAIYKLLSEAVCVLVAWTNASVSSEWVKGECEQARKDGRLVPVVMESNSQIQPPFNTRSYADLIGWTGAETPELARLWESVHNLIERGGGAGYNALSENPWVVENARSASEQLRQLAGEFRSINEVLVANTPAVEDLRAALDEVMKTYRAVTEAVQSFVLPALQTGTLDPKPYVQLAHGNLQQEIEAGRGHCGQILIHYRRVGGVRDAILGRLPAAQLQEVDDTFTQLGTADGDAFLEMTQIGSFLQNDARVIVNNLFARQEDAARKRIAATRLLLEPLERELSGAMIELQQLEASLGHAGA